MSAAPIFKDFRPEDKRDESLSNSGWKRGELEISKAPISFKITQSNQGNTHALKLSFKGALLATYLFDKSLLSGLTKSTEYSERYLGILNDQLIGFIEKNLHIEDIDSARSAFQINNTAPESDRAETVTITPGSQAGSLPSLDDSRVKTPTPPPPVGDGAPKGKPTPSPQRAEPLAAASAAAPVATHSTMPPLPKLTVAFPEPKPEPEAFIPTDATIAEALQELVAAKQRKALLGQTLVGHTDWSPQKMADYLGIDLMLMPQFTAAFSHCETAEAALNSLNHFRAKSYLTDTSHGRNLEKAALPINQHRLIEKSLSVIPAGLFKPTREEASSPTVALTAPVEAVAAPIATPPSDKKRVRRVLSRVKSQAHAPTGSPSESNSPGIAAAFASVVTKGKSNAAGVDCAERATNGKKQRTTESPGK